MILHVWQNAKKWPGLLGIRSEMLTPMEQPLTAPFVKQIAGWNPYDSWGFTTFWGVHLGDEWQFHDIHNDVYMFVLGVRSYKRVWRILEDADP